VILREEGPYTTCSRCQHKIPIALAEWDAGKLVCSKSSGLYCSADGKIQGSVELRQAREVAIDKHEREPEPKLVNPADIGAQLEQIPASSGTYE
jgi:hypothetical protein